MLLLVLIDGHHILHINSSLRESAKLAEQASIAKTQFLSSMSHDIRTPMNAVIGMTELAKRNSDNTEYVRECLDKISSAGNHLMALFTSYANKIGDGEVNSPEEAAQELIDQCTEVYSSME